MIMEHKLISLLKQSQLTRVPFAMALVTSHVACRVTSMSSSGFISLVPSLVLQFPVKKMLKQML